MMVSAAEEYARTYNLVEQKPMLLEAMDADKALSVATYDAVTWYCSCKCDNYPWCDAMDGYFVACPEREEFKVEIADIFNGGM